MTRWLLVHPPLLGPAVLAPLAAELRARGAEVALAEMRATVSVAAGWPQRWSRAAAARGPADAVLGFSGAGVTLPAVAAAVTARRVVWVDALVPARGGETVPDPEFRQRIAPFVSGGRIADWTTWWLGGGGRRRREPPRHRHGPRPGRRPGRMRRPRLARARPPR